MLTPPNVPAVQCIAVFAVCVPNPGRRICVRVWTVDSGPYHMPQLLTHPSAGSMVLVGTGTTASVELEPGELG